MNGSGFHGINARCIDTRMSENIGEAYNVLLQAVKGTGEQMPQVVWKDLFLRYARRFAKLLHVTPNIRSVKRIAVLRHENGSAFSFLRA